MGRPAGEGVVFSVFVFENLYRSEYPTPTIPEFFGSPEEKLDEKRFTFELRTDFVECEEKLEVFFELESV